MTPGPDIFLRSRDTPNSTKPLYVLLSDFGVASREDESPRPDSGPCLATGTQEYHAPELCFDPQPTATQTNLQASPHTSRSDVFAVALAMFCLCKRGHSPHIDTRCLPLRSPAALGRAARPARLDILSARGGYSDYLARTIEWAGAREPRSRPDAQQLVAGVQKQCRLWKLDPNWQTQVAEALPPWAAPKRTIK